MGLEANRQRSRLSKTMRSRIVRIGGKYIPLAEMGVKLVDPAFAPLNHKEIAFFYNKK